MIRRFAKASLSLCILFFSLLIFVGHASAIDKNRMYQDPNDPNVWYFVGMVYFDVWKYASGDPSDRSSWTNGIMPGDSVPVDGFDYEFVFSSGEKVKNVTVSKFDYNGQYATEIFDKARPENKPMDYFSRATSTNYTIVQPVPGKWTGKGTNVAKVPAYVNPGLLKAQIQAVDRVQEEMDNGQVFAPGVQGWRYFFPTLFKIELEPSEGKAIVKHFRTDNTSLNGVDGFKDYEMKLELNKTYSIKPSPDTVNYKYKYYKKKTDADPSSENPLYGDPMTFTYDGKFQIYYLNLYYEGSGGPIDPPELPPTGATCTDPSPGRTMYGEDFNPYPTGVIKADSRGSERFNVLDGIPTTESLYGNVWTKEYLHRYEYQEMVGKCTFQVNVTVMPPPTPPGEEGDEPAEPEEPSTVPVTVDKEYSYWEVKDVQVFKINEAALWNYAFDSGGIRIQPSGYNSPYYATAQTHEYVPDPVPDVTVPFDGDPQAAAESAVSITVRNDTFTFNGMTLMSGSSSSNNAPTPSPIPNAPQIGDNVLFSPGNVIPMTKVNKANQPSTGTIYYGQVSGSNTLNYPIYGINSVTVHTPVVIYPDVSDDKAHNQKTKPAVGRSAIILDRPFTVEMPNSGQHTNYLGYGNRNYLKYIGSKQVRFPFDVYDETKTTFYPKNTWIEVDKTKESFTFFLPVWVDEGFYDVEFRTIAHNAPSGATQQTNANLDLANHIAYDTVPVDAIGRVYDFRITDIADYNWERVFRTQLGSSTPTGASYWIGLNGIDGAPRGNNERFTLPIRPGSNPFYKNVAIKTGYHFKFDFKTKGNMMDKLDGVKITPTFYFVSKDGKVRVPVDLYYTTSKKNFIKVGSPEDKVERFVILNQRLRNVPASELTDTASYKYDKYLTPAQQSAQTKAQYTNTYINKYTKQKTPVGWYRLLMLPEQLRTFIGPKTGLPSGVDVQKANASVQKWYGEYSLPAAPYVVQQGVDLAEWGRTHGGLDEKSPIFLKNGYIVVNFNIETIQDGDTANPYLQYINAPAMVAQPSGSQWKLEGFKDIVSDSYGNQFSLLQGDVVFYNANKSSRDDFQSTVPH
ncbi:DUF5704 domain-containing protein [Bacillus sp. FSL K6-6540]|uniref:DUF5704 domain-containing protein n=1 Tax=Bacillus sp. FSL K6-6540 TaxID=2921512 RepID=UPI0030F56A0E